MIHYIKLDIRIKYENDTERALKPKHDTERALKPKHDTERALKPENDYLTSPPPPVIFVLDTKIQK